MGGRRITVLQPGVRTDEEAAELRRRFGDDLYAALVKQGVIEEPGTPAGKGHKASAADGG